MLHAQLHLHPGRASIPPRWTGSHPIAPELSKKVGPSSHKGGRLGSVLTLRAGFGSASGNTGSGVRVSLISVLGEPTGVVQARNPYNTTHNPHQQPSGASGSISPPTKSSPSGLFGTLQLSTEISTASPTNRRQKPHNTNQPANVPYPAAFPKHAAQGSPGTLPAI